MFIHSPLQTNCLTDTKCNGGTKCPNFWVKILGAKMSLYFWQKVRGQNVITLGINYDSGSKCCSRTKHSNLWVERFYCMFRWTYYPPAQSQNVIEIEGHSRLLFNALALQSFWGPPVADEYSVIDTVVVSLPRVWIQEIKGSVSRDFLTLVFSSNIFS
jgi:hypothetical protein